VLCRLFKKNEESLEVSNCGEGEQTNSAPEELQSDPAPVTVSTSQVRKEDKQLAVIPSISEEK